MTPAAPDGSRLGARRWLLLRFERFSRRRYRTVFLAALLLALAGGWLGSRLSLESDILSLIPAGNPQVDGFKRATSDFGSVSYLLLLLEAEDGAGADELEDFADKFAVRMGRLEGLIEHVDYRLDPGADFLDLFYDNALLYLSPKRLPELAQKLSDEAIRERVQQNRLSLSSPTATFTQELMVNDPLDLLPLLLGRAAGNLGQMQVDLTDGYYLSRDGQSLVMLVKPTRPWQELAFDQELLEAVRAEEQAVRAELGQETSASGAAPGRVKVSYGGRYAIAVDEARLIRADIRFNLLFSLCAVSTLYWICYRRVAALLYSSVPLIVGQAMTFGLAYFVLRTLNASSSAFTALLMGLGTDFVIVMYARYVEERRAGRTLGEATERMVGETGLGVFTGAITSAGTFYAMCISEFRGLSDLGFLIGSGILLCAVSIVFLVPAMIKWNEGVRRRSVESVQKLYVQSFLLERLIPFSARHRRAVLGAIAVLTVGGAFLSTRLEFDDTVEVLRSENSPAYEVQKRMASEFGASVNFMMAVVEAPDEGEALQLAAQVEQRLQPYVADGTVDSYDSILSYLPAQSHQRQILAAVAADQERALDPERIRRTLVEALDQSGFEPGAFAPFIARLERFLRPTHTIRLEELEERGLGRLVRRYVRLVRRYVRRDDGTVRLVIYITTSDARWNRNPPPGLVEDLSAGDRRIVVTGTNIVAREFRQIFQKEAPRALGLGLAVVFVLLLFDFRSLRLTCIAMAQLLCGVAMMLGAMKLVGIHLNYVNAFVATMILGVGIDYGIHLVHRMNEANGRMEAGLLETGKAVVIAALTNIAAFGTLTLGNYPALVSFGQVALIGSITCLITALTLVPAVMARSSGTD